MSVSSHRAAADQLGLYTQPELSPIESEWDWLNTLHVSKILFGPEYCLVKREEALRGMSIEDALDALDKEAAALAASAG